MALFDEDGEEFVDGFERPGPRPRDLAAENQIFLDGERRVAKENWALTALLIR